MSFKGRVLKASDGAETCVVDPDIDATVPELCGALCEIFHLLADSYIGGHCDSGRAAICALTLNLVQRFLVPGCNTRRAPSCESFGRSPAKPLDASAMTTHFPLNFPLSCCFGSFEAAKAPAEPVNPFAAAS
nr:hypothetical protein [Pseudomonas fluorescens]